MNNDIVYFVYTTAEKFKEQKIKLDNCLYFVREQDEENTPYKIYKGEKEIFLKNQYDLNELLEVYKNKVDKLDDFKNKVNSLELYKVKIDNLIENAPQELDTIKEIVDFIKKNENDINKISQSTINKVDKDNAKVFNELNILGESNSWLKLTRKTETDEYTDFRVGSDNGHFKIQSKSSNYNNNNNYLDLLNINYATGQITDKNNKELSISGHKHAIGDIKELGNILNTLFPYHNWSDTKIENINDTKFFKEGLYSGRFTNYPGNNSWGILINLPTTKRNEVTYSQQIFLNENNQYYIRQIHSKNPKPWRQLITAELKGDTLEITL